MEIVLILATLLGGAAALWFFWDKVIDFFRGQPKEEQKSSRPSASSLVVLRELAVHSLLNRSVATAADLEQLKRDIDHWQNSVLKQLDDFGNQSDVTYFRVLGTYQPQNLAGWNSDHTLERNILAERLDRLVEIMRRIEGD